MKIKWLGHASFLITSDKGPKIITDPYSVGGGIHYGQIAESADIVSVSHKHGDHDNVAAVKGKPTVVNVPGKRNIKEVDIQGIPSYHDEVKGKQRGQNLIFCFTLDGMRICHLGDLGHQLEASQIADINQVDILLVPVGGHFTIDAKDATKICTKLNPRIVIPMHYKTAKCEYMIAGVDDFLKSSVNTTDVRQLNTAETEFDKNSLPIKTEIVILQHAM